MTKLTNFVAEYDLPIFFTLWFGCAALAYALGY